MTRPALHLTSITARNGTPAAALTRALASNAAAALVATHTKPVPVARERQTAQKTA